MTQLPLEPCSIPTFYFIGVTTGKSSSMRVFPEWMKILDIDAHIIGIDLPLHAPAEQYLAVVKHIKHDPLVRGALVTTHKIDLLKASRDLFDSLDPHAQLCEEVSCIAKKRLATPPPAPLPARREGEGTMNYRERFSLEGYAKDPISSAKTWQTFVPAGHFGKTHAEVLCFGSGGAAVATTVFLANAADRPRRFTLVDISKERLDYGRHIHAQLNSDIRFEYVLNGDATENDRRMAALPPNSVVINGTGMGKDLPGSPITDSAIFPQNGIVWEFNYRGELNFLRQARQQAAARLLKIEDGWNYFVYGWTEVIAEIFQFDLTATLFKQLDEAAQTFR